MPGVTTKEDLEKELEKQIKDYKEMQAENAYVEKVWAKASDNMKIEIDEELVEAEVENMYADFLDKLKLQGITEELYLQYANTTKEEVKNKMHDEAITRIKYRYLLKEVIKEEKIKVTDKQVEKELDNMAKTYGVSKEDILKEVKDVEYIKLDMLTKAAIEVIKNNE